MNNHFQKLNYYIHKKILSKTYFYQFSLNSYLKYLHIRSIPKIKVLDQNVAFNCLKK